MKKALFPKIGKHVFIDPSAVVVGDVRLGDFSSVWPGTVLRGDIHKITVGKNSNIQDLSVVHVESDKACRIGNYVTIGHRVILHACTVKDKALIGMGSIVMDGAIVGTGTIIGAGSLVTCGQKLQPASLYFGRPAKFVRKLSKKEVEGLKKWALRYVGYAKDHLKGQFHRV